MLYQLQDESHSSRKLPVCSLYICLLLLLLFACCAQARHIIPLGHTIAEQGALLMAVHAVQPFFNSFRRHQGAGSAAWNKG